MKTRTSRMLHTSAIGAALALATTAVSAGQTSPPFHFRLDTLTGPVEKITESEFSDLDGDGDIDAIAWWEDTLRIYKKVGTASLAQAPGPAIDPGTIFHGARLGDVDGDGDLDLAICAETPGVAGFIEGFLNDGSGAFTSAGRISSGAGEQWTHPAFGDVDGNGTLELLAYDSSSQQYSIFWNVDFAAAPATSVLSAATPDSPPQVHDLDGDGDGDILIGSAASGVAWYETESSGASFNGPNMLGLGGRGRDVGDLDGDGDPEIVVAVSGGPVYFDNLGAGQFGPFQRIVTASVNPLGECKCVDVNVDGNIDVAYFGGGGGAYWARNDGAGSYDAQGSFGGWPGISSFEFHDRDGDGDLDPFFSSSNQTNPFEQGSFVDYQNVAFPNSGGPCDQAVPLMPHQQAFVDPATAVVNGPAWACVSGHIDSWYSYTVPYDSTSFTVHLRGVQSGDHPLTIYRGTCGNLVALECATSDAGNRNTRVTIDGAAPLQTYLIRVGMLPPQPNVFEAYFLQVNDNGGSPATCLANPSFESGDLAGWGSSDIADAFVPLEVTGAGADPAFGLFTTEPTSGQYAFRTGFDGDGPGTVTLSQLVDVTPASRRLTFNYRAGWSILNPTAVLDRTFHVVVRDAVSSAVLQSDLFLTAGAQTTVFDTGSRIASVDLSQFIGQTVRLSFEWFVPESNTGPAHFQLDNITCPGVTAPAVGANYCTSVINSTGSPAHIRGSGSPVATHNSLTLTASGIPAGEFGIFVASMTEDFIPGANGSSNGNLCLGGTIGRFNDIQGANGAGEYSLPVNMGAIPQGAGNATVLAGQTWFFQSWYRDPQVGLGSNFTNALRVLFQ